MFRSALELMRLSVVCWCLAGTDGKDVVGGSLHLLSRCGSAVSGCRDGDASETRFHALSAVALLDSGALLVADGRFVRLLSEESTSNGSRGQRRLPAEVRAAMERFDVANSNGTVAAASSSGR